MYERKMKTRWKKAKRLLACVLSLVMIFSSSAVGWALDSADVSSITSTIPVTEPAERQMLFDDGWRFHLGDEANAANSNFDDSAWRSLTLPHDWSIELDFTHDVSSEVGHLDGGTGWYRKNFTLPAEMQGKTINIDFGGVYMDSYVYVNGELVGNHPYGYTPFSFDITDQVVCDGVTENVIAVKATNQITHGVMVETTSRWYSGSGIYRDVYLRVTSPVCVEQYGTKITTPNLKTEYDTSTNTGNVTVNVETTVRNDTNTAQSVVVRSSILNFADNSTVTQPIEAAAVSIPANTAQSIPQTIMVTDPTLWTVTTDHPALYKLHTEVLVDGVVTDSYDSRFGFRWTDFDSNEGFYLNGEWMKLHGVCMHHDQGALGAVSNYRAVERQMQVMKQAGVNAIRVTHNPASDELLEACDRLGLMVVEEAFDCWGNNRGKKIFDYGRFFSKPSTDPKAEVGETWAEFDIKTMVDRGKNFPSIIMWCIGNEINIDISSDSSLGTQTARNLTSWVREIDSTRPVTIGDDKLRGDMNDTSDNLIGTHMADTFAEVDVVGLNYSENRYDAIHRDFPDMLLYGSETSSATKSRGSYSDPQSASGAQTLPGNRLSSYDNSCVGWGRTASDSWIRDRDRKFILGQFVWTGFDYIGEPTPWNQSFDAPPKSSYFGFVDTAGFPKDDYYLYQSQWSDTPMVHILPHWNWEDTALRNKVLVNGKIPVRVYSNAPQVELFFKASGDTTPGLGTSQGVKTFDLITPYQNATAEQDVTYQVSHENHDKLYLEWPMAYQAGTLTAVAYDESGAEISRDVVTTAGQAAKLQLTADRQIIRSDGRDLVYITVDVLDAAGNICPTAENLINFSISGNGRIVGVDNGDAATWERYKDYSGAWRRTTSAGKALVIVQSTEEAGSFTLSATSGGGLASASVTCFTVASDEDLDAVIGYETSDIHIRAGETPDLPQTVVAVRGNGTKETMTVTWAPLPDLSHYGKYTIEGLAEDGGTAVLTIYVLGVATVKETRLLTYINTIPVLPSQVQLILSDKSIEMADVTWPEITAAQVASVGEFEVLGAITGYPELSAKVTVRVTDQIVKTNVALRGTPTALHTGDNIIAMVDGRQEYSISRADRWSNRDSPDTNEWVQVTLDGTYTVGEINLNFFTDATYSVPSQLIIQYWDGLDWVNVQNQSKTSGFVANQIVGQKPGDNVITFTPVATDRIRIVMDQTGDNKMGIIEFQIFSNLLIPESVAQLKGIQINGIDLGGFSPDILEYTVDLGSDTTLPKVTAQAEGLGTYYIVQAIDLDSSAIIVVTAEDGKAERTYTIQFENSVPQLTEVAISAEQTTFEVNALVPLTVTATLQDGTTLNADQYTVQYESIPAETGGTGLVTVDTQGRIEARQVGSVYLTAKVTYLSRTVDSSPLLLTVTPSTTPVVVSSYEAVEVSTNRGVAPVLPAQVTAYVSGSFPRDIAVTWDEIPPESYAAYGRFTVQGTVEGQMLQPSATVIVRDLVVTEKVATATPYGVIPELPTAITVYYSDGTPLAAQAVVWDSMTESMFRVEEGQLVTVLGTVTAGGKELPAEASIRVTSEDTVVTRNYLEQDNGYEMVCAIAARTNDVSYSNDRVTKLNDGIISFSTDESQGKNVWTDWVRGGGSEDWVGGIIADNGQVSQEVVNQVKIGFYDEGGAAGGCNVPQSYKVEYYVGPDDFSIPEHSDVNNPRGHFEDLPNHPFNNSANWVEVSYIGGIPSPVKGAMTVVNFEPVVTSVIRIQMTPKSGDSLGVTEIQFYGYGSSVAIAKNTNDNVYSNDRVTKLNDGIISFSTDENQGKNVWTDWVRGGGSADWIGGIIVEKGAVTQTYVDTVKVGFYDEGGAAGGCNVPQSYQVEYYVGPEGYTIPEHSDVDNPRGHIGNISGHPFNDDANWQEVTYTGGTVPEPVKGAMTVVSFDAVKTSAIRISMVPKSGDSLGATEVQAFGKTANKESTVSNLNIQVNGAALPGFNAGTLEYTVTAQSGTVPVITASAGNHAAITIVQADFEYGTAKVFVTPESGDLTQSRTYMIHFQEA